MLKSVGRLIFRGIGFLSVGVLSSLVRQKINKPRLVSNECWVNYLEENFNVEGMKILEIGSRNVCGSPLRSRFCKADYIGFDVYEGENVDVVGNAHELSSYFHEQSFDLIFSSAVFEHLYAPWIVAEEVSRLLKIGGCCFTETHFSFSSHERPWHFFQCSDMGLRSLFHSGLGFEHIDSGMSNPIFGFFGSSSVGYLRYKPVVELYCHSELLCRKIKHVSCLSSKPFSRKDFVAESGYTDSGSKS